MNPSEVLRRAKEFWQGGPPGFSTYDAFWEVTPLKETVWKEAFLILDAMNGDFDRAIALAEAEE